MSSEYQKPISGSFDAAGQTLEITSPNSGTSVIQLTGSWTGVIVLEGSNDNSNWSQIYAIKESSKLFSSTIESNGVYLGATNGYELLRLRTDSWSSGTANVNVYGSDAASVLQADAKLRGSTDGTLIGNEGDKLKVENTPSSGADVIPSLGTNLKYDDMNSNTGGVARGTLISDTWTKIYDSTAIQSDATGLTLSLRVNLEKFSEVNESKRWEIRLVVGGVEVFGSDGLSNSDLLSSTVYSYFSDITKTDYEWGGLLIRGDVFLWEGPTNLPIVYDTNGVQIFVRKFGKDRNFRAGLVTLTRN